MSTVTSSKGNGIFKTRVGVFWVITSFSSGKDSEYEGNVRTDASSGSVSSPALKSVSTYILFSFYILTKSVYDFACSKVGEGKGVEKSE